MQEKCILDPERDCLGLMKAQELEKDFNEFSRRNTESHDRFFRRLEDLEKHEVIQKEQYNHIKDKLSGLSDDLSELKADSKEVVAKLSPLAHKVESLENVSESVKREVETLKEKPAKRWESIVEKIIGLVVAAVVGFVLAKLGLS